MAFAARCALRALPGIAGGTDATLRDIVLPVVRATLTSGVAAKMPTPEVRHSAHSARSAARSAADSADSAYSAAHSDALKIEEKGHAQVFHNDLWPDGGVPDFFELPLKTLRDFWTADDAVWGFWARWYAGMLNGTPMDWKVQEAVALIKPEVWEEGADAVAERIRGIERLHRTNVTPRLVQTDDGRWDVETSPTIPAEPLEFAVASVEQRLETALQLCGLNLFNETSEEAVIIRRALDRHRHHPSLLAVAFWQACMNLQKNLAGEYPKDDPNLIGLQNTLYTSIEEMCEHSDVIKARIGRLAALERKQDLTPEDYADLELLPIETEDHLTSDAQKQLVEAADDVKGSEKPPRGSIARLGNWVTTLGKGLDEGQKHDKRAKWLLDLGRRLMRVFFPGDDPSD